MRIAMIGTGYVGLVSGACFSEFGVDVVCVDKDKGKIDQLNSGGITISPRGYHRIFDAAGKHAITHSSSSKRVMLPPGHYSLNIADQQVAVQLTEGKIVNIKVE